MNKLFALALLLYTSLAMGQREKPVEIPEANEAFRKAGVKTVRQYICDESGNNCKPLAFMDYDRNGLVVAERQFKKDGSQRNPLIMRYNKFHKPDTVYLQEQMWLTPYQVYTYDAHGNRTSLWQADYKLRLTKRLEYKYDSRNKLVEETDIGPGSSEVTHYSYDDKGRLINLYYDRSIDGRRHNEINIYDDSDHLIRKLIKPSFSDENDTVDFQYNSMGNVIRQTWSRTQNTTLNTYDSKGHLLESSIVDVNGTLISKELLRHVNGLVSERLIYEGEQIKKYYKMEYDTF